MPLPDDARWAGLPPWDPTLGEKMFPAWKAIVRLLYDAPEGVVSHRVLVEAAVAAGPVLESTATSLLSKGRQHGYLVLAQEGQYVNNRRYALSARFRRHLAKEMT